MLDTLQHSIVKIFLDGQECGTGTVLADCQVVTCLHVMDQRFQSLDYTELKGGEGDPYRLEIELEYEGERYSATCLRGNQHHDTCLLHVPTLNAPPLSLLPEGNALAEGEVVYSCGYSAENGLLKGNGVIRHINHMPSKEAPLVMHSAPTESGCSGGALVNTKGQLIGMQCFHVASLPVVWIRALQERSDHTIIPRSSGLYTEVDHFHLAYSASRSLPSNQVPLMEWVLGQPTSQFALESFVLSVDLGRLYQQQEDNTEPIQQALHLALANPPAGTMPLDWAEVITRKHPQGYDAYLVLRQSILKLLESEPSTPENDLTKALSHLEIGNHYYFYDKAEDNMLKALEHYTHTIACCDALIAQHPKEGWDDAQKTAFSTTMLCALRQSAKIHKEAANIPEATQMLVRHIEQKILGFKEQTGEQTLDNETLDLLFAGSYQSCFVSQKEESPHGATSNSVQKVVIKDLVKERLNKYWPEEQARSLL